MVRSKLSFVRRLLAAVLLVSGLGLAGCASQPAAPAAQPGGLQSSLPPGSSVATTLSSSSLAPTSSLAGPGPVASWLASERAFYRAAILGEPSYGPLLASFVPGSPAADEVVSYLTALSQAGVVGPAHYRVGNGRLVMEKDARAEVKGCAFDTGSRYRASQAGAPAALGGGAGLTSYSVTLELVGNHWLVWSSRPRAVSSNESPGPCQGF
jgi:hypothetical protein